MVLQKRLDYGFNGYQVPTMPRASRSARGKRSFKRKVENNNMCAFELLAAVAGKLLQEGETSPASSNIGGGRDQPTVVKDIVKKEKEDDEKPHKVEPSDQGSCDESVFVSEPGLQEHNQYHTPKKSPHSQKDTSLGHNSPRPLEVRCLGESPYGKSKNDIVNCTRKFERNSPCQGESCKGKVEDAFERLIGFGTQKTGSISSGNVLDLCSSEDPMELDIKPPPLISSDSSIDVPLCKDSIPHGPFARSQDDIKVGGRDDDENSSGCTQPSNISLKTFKAPPRIGDRRVRKLFGSRYWKVAPKLRDGERCVSDGNNVPAFRNQKICYTRQRSQRNFPFKRRKVFQQCTMSTSDQGISSEGLSSSPKKAMEGNPFGSGATSSGASSLVVGQESSLESKDSHVKLSIKSFKIPELFIEIPETATVGSLKRTVLEALTAILGGGLRVGVLLQGKKVRDDNCTLLQSGICRDNKLNSLGFALEPNASPVLSPEDPPFLLPCETPQPLARYPATPALEPGTSEVSLTPPTQTINLGNCGESDHDSVPTPTNLPTDKMVSDSRALVAIPAASMEAFAVVPFNRRSRRSELVQRRIRRPFSVSEVEALVQAVEKLGTGRWRDVKLRAFDNAKHRTYVDLKDKWKTLVHTARISPQQRRGEPVPQELLDRVLAAHAYWSQQQAKQQMKL